MSVKLLLVGVKLVMVIVIAVFVFTPMDTPVEVGLCLGCIVAASACLMVLKNSDETGVRLWRKKTDATDEHE